MWVSFLILGAIVAIFLFTRFRRFAIPAPLALLLSVGIVVLPFVLIPLIVIWLVVRWIGQSYRSGGHSDQGKLLFCSRCGADVPNNVLLCPHCGNSVQVSG